MLKYLIFPIIVILFSSCTPPKPVAIPDWYNHPPKSDTLFYASGIGKNKNNAKNVAIYSFRNRLHNALNKRFNSISYQFNGLSNTDILNISISNKGLANTIPIKFVKIEKSIDIEDQTLVLISIPRSSINEYVNTLLKEKLTKINNNQNVKEDIAIYKYISLKKRMKKSQKLVSLLLLQDILHPKSEISDKYKFINQLYSEKNELKNTISFYILSDGNSMIYAKYISDAIKQEGFRMSNNLRSKDSLKLVINSTTTNSQEYLFMRSSNLIKFTTYDMKKNKISFIQHTFIAESKKDYSDAKEHSALNMKSKIMKQNILTFLGIKI